jgi:hypothetical protein
MRFLSRIRLGDAEARNRHHERTVSIHLLAGNLADAQSGELSCREVKALVMTGRG